MYDVIIVGARCGGAATALQLARRGARVLVLDHRPPCSGHVPAFGNVVAPGALLLREWGLLDRLVDAGCPPVRTMRVHVGGSTIEQPAGRPGAPDAMYVADRRVLDPILCEAAIAAGAEMRFDVRVRGLQWADGRVVGIDGHAADGTPVVERARLVVGADGKQSSVARTVGARTYRARAAGSCAFSASWSGTGHEAIEVHLGDGRQTIVFPTHDDVTWVIAARPAEMWGQYRADPEREYLAQIDATPGLRHAMAGAWCVSRLAGNGNLDGFFRQAAGPGWTLVGDAGHTKDPGPGRGISDAFIQADLLAAAVHEVLEGRAGWDDALGGFARERDRCSMEIYDLTHDLADERDPAAAIDLQLALEEACGRQLTWLLDRLGLHARTEPATVA